MKVLLLTVVQLLYVLHIVVKIQQPLANGSWQIDKLSRVHVAASIYGLMTFATRQILA